MRTEATILPARTPADIDAFRVLCRRYAASLPFSLCFQGFDAEMAALPGKYTPPMGDLFLARLAQPNPDHPVGIVAVRPLPPWPGFDHPPGVAELKRMYVEPDARGRGLGKALARTAIDCARAAGYRHLWLDSEPDFTAAIATYRALGFQPIPRYNDDPHEQTVYLGLQL